MTPVPPWTRNVAKNPSPASDRGSARVSEKEENPADAGRRPPAGAATVVNPASAGTLRGSGDPPPEPRKCVESRSPAPLVVKCRLQLHFAVEVLGLVHGDFDELNLPAREPGRRRVLLADRVGP